MDDVLTFEVKASWRNIKTYKDFLSLIVHFNSHSFCVCVCVFGSGRLLFRSICKSNHFDVCFSFLKYKHFCVRPFSHIKSISFTFFLLFCRHYLRKLCKFMVYYIYSLIWWFEILMNKRALILFNGAICYLSSSTFKHLLPASVQNKTIHIPWNYVV